MSDRSTFDPDPRQDTVRQTSLVAVLGAVNLDLVVPVPHLPARGETVLGGDLARYHGGKGGNQAVAAARAGATVRMIGAVGDDPDGAEMRDALIAEGIEVDHLRTVDGSSGHALICVAPDGENQIVVAPGANARLAHARVEVAVADATVLLASLEVPALVVEAAMLAARQNGVRIVLNAAPPQPLAASVMACGPILVVNEDELRQLTNGADEGPDRLLARGAKAVIVTRGSRGVSWLTADERVDAPAYRLGAAVDATGAGDTFCGTFAAWLAAGEELAVAVAAANVAAGMSVRSRGARAGMPYRSAVVNAMHTTRAESP